MRTFPKLLTQTVSKSLAHPLNLSLVEAPRYINNFKNDFVYKKFNELNGWYTRIIGLDEVKLYQDRVVNLQERLLEAQERRREIGATLALIRKRSNDLQDQIHKVKRQDDLQKFLDLMREETEILREEQEVTAVFTNCDREEREIFTAFTNAIRDSHEKQRAQLEYTKYIGLILSIAGSFLAFTYSSLRKNDLKNFIERNLGSVNPVAIERELDGVRRDYKVVLSQIDRNHAEVLKLINKKSKSGQIVKAHDLNWPPMLTSNDQAVLVVGVLCLVGFFVIKQLF